MRNGVATSAQPRVIIVQPYLNHYRIPLFSQLEAEAQRCGFAVKIFAGNATGDRLARADAADGSTFVTPLRQRPLRLGSRTVVFRSMPAGWAKADLVVVEHAVRNVDSFFILIGRRLLRRPTALWGHGHTITEKRSALVLLMQRAMMRLATHYFAYTLGSANRAIALGADARAVTVLNNTIDTDEYACEAARIRAFGKKMRPNRWVVAYFGGLDASKRIGEMLEAARLAHERDPRFLLVIGGRGELEEDVRRASADGSVEYLGQVGEKAKASWAADAQLLFVPGRVGLIAIDSFVLAAPIVAERWPFHAPEFEYLNESNSIVLGAGVGPADYADEFLRLIADPPRLQRLQQGASGSLSGYSMRGMVEAFVAGIKSATRNRPEA